jgi:hypothetical protein
MNARMAGERPAPQVEQIAVIAGQRQPARHRNDVPRPPCDGMPEHFGTGKRRQAGPETREDGRHDIARPS